MSRQTLIGEFGMFIVYYVSEQLLSAIIIGLFTLTRVRTFAIYGSPTLGSTMESLVPLAMVLLQRSLV